MRWIDRMALFIIACCLSGIGATVLFLLGHEAAAAVLGNAGPMVLGLPALYLDYRRFERSRA